MEFKSPQYRIRIPVVSARNNVENEKEKAASQAVIGQERLYLIEAAIVRIMKTRKQMAHEALVNETIIQLSPRFLPSSKMIKDGIGKLLDREYLQRSPEDPRLYNYLA
ncbi:Cullin-3 [Coemansia sp. RSA 1694]|nr:Cullin-3 [Coemansia sp. RSA 1694]